VALATVEDLLDEREIAEQLLNYCRGVDRLDRDLLASVWHAGGTVAVGADGLPQPIGYAIEDIIRQHESLTFHHHNLADPLIRIVGDRAVSEANVVVIRRQAIQGSGANEGNGAEGPWRDEHVRIRFLDQWSRRDGRWAIDHHRVIPVVAWEQLSAGLTGGVSRRDRTDPVYAHLHSLGGEGVFATRANDISELRAERDIRRQLATYSRGVDRFDPDIWKSFWHADATLRYEAVALEAVAHDIALTMTLGHYPWAAHQHQTMRAAIRICGNQAVSETMNFSMLHGYADHAGHAVQDHFRGRYLDTWERREGKWAIKQRFTPRGAVWQQAVKSEKGQFMRRDRSDPSYALFASLEKAEADDLTLLADEQAIKACMRVACCALDRLDAALLQSVWWPGARLVDRTHNIDCDAEAVNEQLLGELAAMAGSMHLITLTAIDINDDRAVSETYFENSLVQHRSACRVTAHRHVRGRYLDRWSKRDGRWGLDHREIIQDFAWEQETGDQDFTHSPERLANDPFDQLFVGEFSLTGAYQLVEGTLGCVHTSARGLAAQFVNSGTHEHDSTPTQSPT